MAIDEAMLAHPVSQFVFECLRRPMVQEYPHPSLRGRGKYPSKRRIDFAVLSRDGQKIKFAIETKLLPCNATAAKYGHDVLKDILRLAHLRNPKFGAYMLIAMPVELSAANGRWTKISRYFLSREDGRLVCVKGFEKCFWHANRNLEGPRIKFGVQKFPDGIAVTVCAYAKCGQHVVYILEVARRGGKTFKIHRKGDSYFLRNL